MQQMWSPWRSQHIESFQEKTSQENGDQSLFTRLVLEEKDEENLILWRGETMFVIMNRYPYNNGHVMILPFRQVAEYEDLTREEMIEMAATVGYCIRWIKYALRPEGFNIGINVGKAAGAGIPSHLHVHVVPRWNGDTNFMPTVGQIKVISEALQDTYRKLRQAIEKLGTSIPPDNAV